MQMDKTVCAGLRFAEYISERTSEWHNRRCHKYNCRVQ